MNILPVITVIDYYGTNIESQQSDIFTEKQARCHLELNYSTHGVYSLQTTSRQ